ncbi:MAG: Bro-N domain-containing protein [Planctomycetaceae bacterium]|nr:Bro-N domain-containing protein [Planctomycetaceae bacterium]
MNTNLSVFTFENHEVRIVDHDGNAWFVAKDVCEILGYTGSVSDVLTNHCRDGVANRDTIELPDSLGRKQPTTIISELNLNRLIMRSKKPEAEKFQDWVCGEVIPSIRKTGQYSVNGASPLSPETVSLMVAGKKMEVTTNREFSVSLSETGCVTLHIKPVPAKKSPKEKENTNDSITMMFFIECCSFGHYSSVDSEDLYERYIIWFSENAFERFPTFNQLSRVGFFKALNRLFRDSLTKVRRDTYQDITDKKRHWCYNGLALRYRPSVK